MNKKKVKTLHSMMLKIVCLFSLGVFLMSATLILISLPRSQDMTKTLVQNYMMSSVKSNGYIIDTLMAVNGKNIIIISTMTLIPEIGHPDGSPCMLVLVNVIWCWMNWPN